MDVRDWSLESLRSQISTIEQDIFLFSRTIAENIAFGARRARRPGADRAGRARRPRPTTSSCSFADGYETVIGERGVTLSGGQRQRIAIARAFLTDPRILILDDSTSAIDSATEDQIQQAIRRVLRRPHHAADHPPAVADPLGRPILVLRNGELVDQGTHEELLERCELYRRIFARYEQQRSQSLGQGGASDARHSGLLSR